MKNRKDKTDAGPANPGTVKSTKARTAGGKKLNPEVMASAEQKALEGLKQRTEEGHLKAGRTPPSQGVAGRRLGGTAVIGGSIRPRPGTRGEKLPQQTGPRPGFTRA